MNARASIRLVFAGALAAFACARSKDESPENRPAVQLTPGAGGVGCAAEDCAALDSDCTRGTCVPPGGCVAEPLPDGEPCGLDGRCGVARCAAGRCVPFEPPDCSDLDGACHTGRCDLREGCIAEPKRILGVTCSEAVTLEALNSWPARADTECGAPVPVLAEAAGHAAYFALDLGQWTEPAPVTFLFGADFPLASALYEGSCEDPSLVARGRQGPWFGGLGEVELHATLDPGRYWVIAAGTEPGVAGPIELAARLGDSGGRELPLGAHCAEPLPLANTPGVHVELSHIAGPAVEPDPSCELWPFFAETCYGLDLSDRSEETLFRVELEDAWGHLFRAEPGEPCRELVGAGQFFSARLSSGRYVLALEVSDDGFGLRTALSDTSECSAVNDSCSSAFEIDTSRSPLRLRGDTACRKVLPTAPQDRDSPQLYFHLDLSEYRSPVLLRPDDSDRRPSLRVVEQEACGTPSSWHSSYVLAPRAYSLVVEGTWGFPFDFQIELTPTTPSGRADCIPSDVVRCALNSSLACQERGLADPACVAMLEPCGIDWPPLDDLCADAPECCAAGSASSTDCERLFEEAGARCTDCLGEYCWFEET